MVSALSLAILQGAEKTWGAGRYSVTCVAGKLRLRKDEVEVDPALFTKRAVQIVREILKREVKCASKKGGV